MVNYFVFLSRVFFKKNKMKKKKKHEKKKLIISHTHETLKNLYITLPDCFSDYDISQRTSSPEPLIMILPLFLGGKQVF